MSLYNLRFIKPLDEDYLVSVLSRYETVLSAEDGIAGGGFGEYLGALIIRRGLNISFASHAVPDSFAGLGRRDELLSRYGLDGPGLAASARALCKKPSFRVVSRAVSE
jgi:1-deoxy-D-xylulose-5-phosphate synthase